MSIHNQHIPFIFLDDTPVNHLHQWRLNVQCLLSELQSIFDDIMYFMSSFVLWIYHTNLNYQTCIYDHLIEWLIADGYHILQLHL